MKIIDIPPETTCFTLGENDELIYCTKECDIFNGNTKIFNISGASPLRRNLTNIHFYEKYILIEGNQLACFLRRHYNTYQIFTLDQGYCYLKNESSFEYLQSKYIANLIAHQEKNDFTFGGVEAKYPADEKFMRQIEELMTHDTTRAKRYKNTLNIIASKIDISKINIGFTTEDHIVFSGNHMLRETRTGMETFYNVKFPALGSKQNTIITQDGSTWFAFNNWELRKLKFNIAEINYESYFLRNFPLNNPHFFDYSCDQLYYFDGVNLIKHPNKTRHLVEKFTCLRIAPNNKIGAMWVNDLIEIFDTDTLQKKCQFKLRPINNVKFSSDSTMLYILFSGLTHEKMCVIDTE